VDVRHGVLLVFALLAFGCVERKLWVRTEPAGARVTINGERVGESPVAWSFDHYGTVLVEVQLEGHLPAERVVRLRSPWYQKPVIDFFADVLCPFRIHDEHEVTFPLEPFRRLTEEEKRREIEALTEAARRARAEAAGEGEEKEKE